MKEPGISLFVITKNEAHNIAACLDSARALVQEIIIVDSYSTDGTVRICEKFGARIYQHPFENFTQQKNTALSQVTREWALSLDADETLTPELASEIYQITLTGKANGYRLPRVNEFLGKRMKHSGIKKEYIVRLVRTEKAKFVGGKVHEKLEVQGRTRRLKNVFVHHPYDNIEDYFAKFNKYTTLAAQTMFDSGKRVGLLRVLLTVPFEFMRRYVLKLGFLDGIRGLIWASFSCFYVFVKYMKLWFLWDQIETK